MRSASLQRIDNLQRLVAGLAQRSMGPQGAAALLDVSERAARNYLKELEDAGVAECVPGCRSRMRLHADPVVSEHFLGALVERVGQQQVSLRHSTSRHCTNPGKKFLHVLADDVRFPLVLHRHPVRRDPLVAALFGVAARAADR